MRPGRLHSLRRPARLLLWLLCTGCATGRKAVIDAFPPGSMASPWTLQGEVWSGTFDEARAALGDDADRWAAFNPSHVWLAIYGHEDLPERRLKVRCLAFGSPQDARRAFQEFAPPGAQPFSAGDGGCWTEIGVLFHWGRLVFDVFGDSATWGSQVQASYLAAMVGKRMPAAAPDDPQ